jgi:hypothetical protein
VPRVSDLFYRYRPAGVLGAARAVAVPADRARRLEAELSALFAGLAATEEECLVLSERRDVKPPPPVPVRKRRPVTLSAVRLRAGAQKSPTRRPGSLRKQKAEPRSSTRTASNASRATWPASSPQSTT